MKLVATCSVVIVRYTIYEADGYQIIFAYKAIRPLEASMNNIHITNLKATLPKPGLSNILAGSWSNTSCPIPLSSPEGAAKSGWLADLLTKMYFIPYTYKYMFNCPECTRNVTLPHKPHYNKMMVDS